MITRGLRYLECRCIYLIKDIITIGSVARVLSETLGLKVTGDMLSIDHEGYYLL